MRSDDPATVSVDASGALVAHRNGKARIETLHGEGSSLEVEVRAAASIAIVPAQLAIEPGRSAELGLVDAETGERLPASAAEWVSRTFIRRPAASVRRASFGGKVQAGNEPGTVEVSARYSEAVAHAEVVVGSAARPKLSVSPPRARLRAGEVRAFQAFSSAGPVDASWESGNGRVLAPLRGGLFQARAAGRATACASYLQHRVCTTVEVTP
jgi:hypothetical protein